MCIHIVIIVTICIHTQNSLAFSMTAILLKLVLENDVSLQYVHPLGSLVSCSKFLIKNIQSISLKHFYREINMVAYCFAKQSLTFSMRAILFYLY